MKEELEQHNFQKMNVANHYNLKHKIHGFYMKERKKAYDHWPLNDEEPFRNVSNKVEMKKIRARLQEHA